MLLRDAESDVADETLHPRWYIFDDIGFSFDAILMNSTRLAFFFISTHSVLLPFTCLPPLIFFAIFEGRQLVNK
uniref:Uncharacterized protein n=1 Tax=Ascaris lumbricoides TaxID=6252 RepID=A0A0M3IRC2_ASCLU